MCHDGSVAPGTEVTLPSAEVEIPAHGDERAHPVEADYLQAALRRPGWLTPVSALPRQLLLSAGLVTCVTCHHPQSRERWRRALPLAGSALCFACHPF